MSRISLSQAFRQWQELARELPPDDRPMNAESWNDYTDALCKDGELCALQYHYAPAYDEDMPGEGSRFDPLSDDRKFILTAMGLSMRATRISARPDNTGAWGNAASHWRVTLTRNRRTMRVFYSMGSAYKGAPEVYNVFWSLLCDSDSVDGTFSDWCASYGFDEDSRKAEQNYKACKRIAASLARLFSNSELRDLRELFEDA